MSYILDALRKADAQRARDPVRGIHAQPLRSASRSDARAGLKPGLLAAGAAAIAVLGWAGWYAYRDRGPVPASQPPAVIAQAPAVRVAPPPPTAAPAPPAVRAPSPVVGSAIQPPPPAPAIPAVVPVPLQAGPPTGVDPRNVPRPSLRGAGPMPGGAAPVQGAPMPAPVPPHPSTATAPPITGLPPDAPKLAISGGVYSTNRVQRMLIVNGQVFNEGSEIGPGVVLEEIKPKTAVLRFRGATYNIVY